MLDLHKVKYSFVSQVHYITNRLFCKVLFQKFLVGLGAWGKGDLFFQKGVPSPIYLYFLKFLIELRIAITATPTSAKTAALSPTTPKAPRISTNALTPSANAIF